MHLGPGNEIHPHLFESAANRHISLEELMFPLTLIWFQVFLNTIYHGSWCSECNLRWSTLETPNSQHTEEPVQIMDK